ncbi:MAG: glycosyltransferase family 2 protein [Acidobacteriota bacterium]
MREPLVSVIIPAYKQEAYLGQAIASVLNQTYSRFEIIVVNDASPDNTAAVVRGFSDPRLRLVSHERNRGLPAARNTGMRASAGELLALLDADDFFHRDKLRAHVDFLQAHPEIAVTYNARCELHHSSTEIREIWRPPLEVGLPELAAGFPFSPSDMVLRRNVAFEAGLFNESCIWGAEDVDFPCRLALAGSRFASVDRPLNYRRYHAGTRGRHLLLEKRLEDYTQALQRIFADPRCPAQAQAFRNQAFLDKLLEVGYLALANGMTEFGQKCVREAIGLDAGILDGKMCPLVVNFLHRSIRDENQDHAEILTRVALLLPPGLESLRPQFQKAIGQGYLLRGARSVLWGQLEAADRHFARAAHSVERLDAEFLARLADQLITLQQYFGDQRVGTVLRELKPRLRMVDARPLDRRLKACLAVNSGFRSFREGDYAQVPRKVIQAVANNPGYVRNRGVLAILARSLLISIRRSVPDPSIRDYGEGDEACGQAGKANDSLAQSRG